jgi:2-phosphosulfolactate phosphatase
VTSPHSQASYQVRFDWGIEGADTVASDADIIVIVDVLSFTTTVEIATSLGLAVVPCAPEDSEFVAHQLGAVLAGPRNTALSLSPSSITAESIGGLTKVAIASPNGSRIAASLNTHGGTVIAGSLRNAGAVARWILDSQQGGRLSIAIIAAGEARDDGTTRFAVEDLLGAGAIIDALAAVGLDACSPEAAAAAASFSGLKRATKHLVTASASGRELVESGFAADVALASRVDVSTTVPVLREFAFRA